MLSFVVVLRLRGIAPHFFELVEPAHFGMHDVDDHIHVIDQHPFGMLKSFLAIGKFTSGFFHRFFHAVGQCLYLGSGGGFAHHKKIGYRFGYLAQINGYDVFRFLVEQPVENAFEKPGLAVDGSGWGGFCL